MIRLFFGSDTFDSTIAVKKDAKKYAEDNSKELEIIYGSEIKDPTYVLEAYEGMSFFYTGKVLLIKRCLENKSLSEYIQSNLQQINDYEVFIWEEEVDQRTKFFKLLKEHTIVQEFKIAKNFDFIKWTKSLSSTLDLRLTTEEIYTVLEFTGTNKWAIYNELKKIKQFRAANHVNNDISLILSNYVYGEIEIWKLIEYFSQKKRDLFIKELKRLMLYDDKSQLILTMLVREINLYISIYYIKSEQQDFSKLNLHPFVLKKTLQNYKNFSEHEIINILKALATIDVHARNGTGAFLNEMIIFADTFLK